jgi:hypothetical protein
MSQTVEESDLDFRHFGCCSDEDLYPFGCPRCGRLMVFCYECDTLHGDLNDLAHSGSWAVNNFDTSAPIFSCPQGAYPFEYFFIRDGKYKTSFDQWQRAGVSHEWHLVVGNAFRHLAFHLSAGLGQPVVVIAPTLLQTWLVPVGSATDPVAGDGSEVATSSPVGEALCG